MRNGHTWVTTHKRGDDIIRGHWRDIEGNAVTPQRLNNNDLRYNRISNIMFDPEHPDALRLGIDIFIEG